MTRLNASLFISNLKIQHFLNLEQPSWELSLQISLLMIKSTDPQQKNNTNMFWHVYWYKTPIYSLNSQSSFYALH